MADRTVSVTLLAKTSGFVSGMKAATQATKDFTASGLDKVGKNEQHINGLANKAGALGLALTGMAVLAVKAFTDFDQAMSAVAATGEDAAGRIDDLREAAIVAGRDTAFSAREAAGGVEELLKAGVSAKDVLGGGLSGALNLAAAGAIGVSDAAEIAATAMTQFKLGGDKVNHVADLLASGASKAQGGVSDLGMALKQSGLVANQTGLSIEETTAGLTAFAAAGLIGSDAGTSFKSMLQRLTPQSKEAQQAMDDLGISAYDSQGQFIGLERFAGNLRTALIKLTPEQRNSALATIFGSDAVRAASVIYENGSDGIRTWIDAVDDQGFAAETAATRLDNLAGDMEQLRGSVETALIGMGEAADGPLRDLVQRITGVVNAFSDAPDSVKGITLALVGGGGLVLLGLAGLGKLAIGINDTRLAMQALGVSAKSAGLAVAGIGGALAIATIAVTQWASAQAEAKARTDAFADTLDEFGNRTDRTVSKINDALSSEHGSTNLLDRVFGKNASSLIDDAEKFGLAIEDLQGYILGNEDAVKRVQAATKAWSDENANAFTGDWIYAPKEFTNALDDQADALTGAEKQSAQKALADEKAGVAQGDLGDEYADTTAEVEDQTNALEKLIDAQAEAAGIVLSNREAQRQFQAAIDDATTALEKNKAGLDINTEAGRANQSALDDIAAAGIKVIDTMEQNGATQEQLTGQMGATREAFLNAAKAFGLGADEANRLADELGLIPDRITPVIDLNTLPARATLKNFLDGINNSSATIGLYARNGAPKAFGSGGYTGDGGKWEPKGIVHGGEFVTNQAATSKWRPVLEAINQDRYVPGIGAGAGIGAGSGDSGGSVQNVTINEVSDPRGTYLAFTRRSNMADI